MIMTEVPRVSPDAVHSLSSSPQVSSYEDLNATEEDAKYFLKRCYYSKAESAFQRLLDMLYSRQQQERQGSSEDGRNNRREIFALEGLAMARSRQLDDASAEAFQRQALTLRCRAWEMADRYDREATAAAKLAAVPCLRNLASFVSNQGRYCDAETLLRSVLKIIADSLDLATPESPQEVVLEGVVPHDDQPRSRDSSIDGASMYAEATEESSPNETGPDPPPADLKHRSSKAQPEIISTTNNRLPEHVGHEKSGGPKVAPRIRTPQTLAAMLGGKNTDGSDVAMASHAVATRGAIPFLREQRGESLEQMMAVTNHQLAVVFHAQGRVEEARDFLEDTVAALKSFYPLPATSVGQALHDLAGMVCHSDADRAYCLYREALELLESAKGKNHFSTATTLAKLGALVADGLAASANLPPTPAAAAGPGSAGVARAAGLAEAVCAQPTSDTPSSSVSAVLLKGCSWDTAADMIKRAIFIQDRQFSLRHPSVASSMRYMAELYRKQGRLSEAEPLFRRAIAIWDASPRKANVDVVAALRGMTHCVLAGAGADWLGRFEKAFALMDQAYHIASSQRMSDRESEYPLSRLILEALRLIRSRQRQGRGDPQPASADTMNGIWSGRWNPSAIRDTSDNNRTSNDTDSEGHDLRCAVCLEEFATSEEPVRDGNGTAVEAKQERSITHVSLEVTPKIGSAETVQSTAEPERVNERFAYLPCEHRFHIHCISRWLVHSSSCPSCRCQVEDDEIPEQQSTSDAENHVPLAATRTRTTLQLPPSRDERLRMAGAVTATTQAQTERDTHDDLSSTLEGTANVSNNGDGNAGGLELPAPFA